VIPGELQASRAANRKGEPVDQAEPEVIISGAPRCCGTFSIAMYRMEIAISVSMSGGNHRRPRSKVIGEAIRVIECAT